MALAILEVKRIMFPKSRPMRAMITQVGTYYLGQPVDTVTGLREFSDEEYAVADVAGIRRYLRDEKIFNGPGPDFRFMAVPWDTTMISSTEGKIYKICLQLNTRNPQLAKIAFNTLRNDLVNEMGKWDAHRLLSKKYVWDRPTGNVILYKMNGFPDVALGPINSINLMFTASFIADQLTTSYTHR